MQQEANWQEWMAEPEAGPVAATKEGSDSNSPAHTPHPLLLLLLPPLLLLLLNYFFTAVLTSYCLCLIWKCQQMQVMYSDRNPSSLSIYIDLHILSIVRRGSHCRIHRLVFYSASILRYCCRCLISDSRIVISKQNSSGSLPV